ncbi:MAG: asparagine synthase-related protein [Planctomycetota bacterium]
MLVQHPQTHGTLILRRDRSGHLMAYGPENMALGYSVSSAADPHVGDSEADQHRKGGVWARWAWNGSTLTVTNDRFGFLPIYFAELPDGFVVSTSIPEILGAGVSATLNDAAIAVFLRLGYYVGNDTPFASIRLLPPCSRLTWNGAGCHLTQSAPAIPGQQSTLSRADAVRLYGERFQHAVEAMLPQRESKMCVPLSAGRDSRHILYALVRAGRNPEQVITARSAPPRPSTDAEMAARITASLQLPHTIIEQSDDRFADEIEKDLLTGFCADEHAQMVPVARWLNENAIDVSWDGIAGDIVSCGVYNDSGLLEQFRHRRFDALSSFLLADEGYLNGALSDAAYRRWNRGLAIDRLSQELALYADLPNPVAPFFFFNRVRRELALCPFGMLNQRTQILAPYLDHDLFDLLIDLPFEYFKGRQFHSEAIDQFYPELPKFDYVSSPTGSVPERRSRIWRFAGRMATYSLQSEGRSPWVRRSFLLPRLAKAMLNSEFGTEVPVLFSRLLVMLHLENALRKSSC